MISQPTDHKPYPRYLRVLCILSAISGITSVFFRLFSAMSHPDDNVFNAVKQAEGQPDMLVYAEEFEQVFRLHHVNHHLSIAALFIMGLFGVREMYKLRKKGFFMYGLAHILIVFYPILMVHQNVFSERQATFDGVVTLLFIVFYASQLKYMSSDDNLE